jgi:hypothetical protein
MEKNQDLHAELVRDLEGHLGGLQVGGQKDAGDEELQEIGPDLQSMLVGQSLEAQLQGAGKTSEQ